MDVVSLDTEDESDHFLRLCQKKSSVFESLTYIGGIASSGFGADGWFWWNSGERITYQLDWAEHEPNFIEGKEYCLSVAHYANLGVFKLNDISCFGQHELKFICQQSQLRD